LLSSAVLLVAHVFHPLNVLAANFFLNGDVRHYGGRSRSMPVFLTRRNPDHISWPYFLDRTTPALDLASASRHDQDLTERTGMPCRAGTGLKRDGGARRA
jgi:hypothetical protein